MRSRILLVGAFTSVFTFQIAHASTVYTYTGQNFTNVSAFDPTPPIGSYTTSMNVSGTITLSNLLAPNLPLQDITAQILDFAFFDGRTTITKATASQPSLTDFFIETDAAGNITRWGIQIFKGNFFLQTLGEQTYRIETSIFRDQGVIAECTAVGSLGCSFALTDAGFNERTPGGWSNPDIATPLPAALPLFASGLGALGLLGWRRKKKRPALAAMSSTQSNLGGTS